MDGFLLPPRSPSHLAHRGRGRGGKRATPLPLPHEPPGFPSVSLIFRKMLVERVDLVPQEECKLNPHWAARFGVPARVCGPHGHHWPDNRDHLLTDAPWGLPCRRPLPPNLRRLPQVLPWLAGKLTINLPDDWREFDVPPQTDLFPE